MLNEKLTFTRFKPISPNLILLFGRSNYRVAAVFYYDAKWKNKEVNLLELNTKMDFTPHNDGISDKDKWNKMVETAVALGSKKALTSMSLKQFVARLHKDGYRDEMIEQVFPMLKSELENVDVSKVGGFDIVDTGVKNLGPLEDVISTSVTFIKTRLCVQQELCYGKIIPTNSLGKTLATYSISSDSIQLSTLARRSDTSVKTFIHELMHRYWHKFMSDGARALVVAKHQETKNDVMGVKLHIGDIVQLPSGNVAQVIDVKYHAGIKYHLKKLVQNTDGEIVHAEDKVHTVVRQDQVVEVKIIKGVNSSISKSPFAVSAYALSSPGEFFSEICAHAAVDNIKVVLTWLKKEVLK